MFQLRAVGRVHSVPSHVATPSGLGRFCRCGIQRLFGIQRELALSLYGLESNHSCIQSRQGGKLAFNWADLGLSWLSC